MSRQHRIELRHPRLTALAACAALVGGTLAAMAAPTSAAARQASAPAGPAAASRTAAKTVATAGCHLGHGIKHVIQFTFDNIHYFRDNPNVLPTCR